ncbi:MAG: phage tail sheath family protein [Balneolaceae bacterium]|nr:MAG: phage tail sheath family protein [Balneolaceae bacterium]
MSNYRTPGVYIEEIPSFPPSVAQVETAIPAFIGYTEKGPGEPTRIGSMVDYRSVFGGPRNGIGTFTIAANGTITSPSISPTPDYRLYYMLEMFFANGGGDCYIISVGNYTDTISNTAMADGLELLNKEDEPTLILFPDAASPVNSDDHFDLYKAALAQCTDRKDRFLICDVDQSTNPVNTVRVSASDFRDNIGANDLLFGAAYFPNLKTTMSYQYAGNQINVDNNGTALVLRHSDETIRENPGQAAQSLFHADNGAHRSTYFAIRKTIESVKLVLPPSAAIAGIYARTDSTRGVWKAPANVSLNRVSAPSLLIDHKEQEDLNVTSTGKSINAIRSFKGKGVMVWGARTLAGNDNEWRYVPVRRFFNMVEESVKNASEKFVFEPNDANTWMKVKAMIENYLITLWRAGAMMGAKPEDAFFVKVGLGETMTPEDVLEGKMIVEIGMAVVRPAEFIILRFSHKMMES